MIPDCMFGRFCNLLTSVRSLIYFIFEASIRNLAVCIWSFGVKLPFVLMLVKSQVDNQFVQTSTIVFSLKEMTQPNDF